MLKSHHRYGYSSINERLPLTWPGGKKLAVFFGINLECFAFGAGIGEQLRPSSEQIDVFNFSWRDYGLRVGAPRLLTLFESLKIPFSVMMNSIIPEAAPGLWQLIAAKEAEIIAHGRTNSEHQGQLNEMEENVLIRDVTSQIAAHVGSKPAGWLGPAASETHYTLDLLQEYGYRYTLDWCFDEQPIWLHTRSGKILSIPLTQELNDLNAIIWQKMTPQNYAEAIVDQFEEMLIQAKETALVMGIALHPYICAHPFRLKHLRHALKHISKRREEVLLATPGEIADFYYSMPL